MRLRPVELEDFLGDWRDSMGHLVRVDWSRPGNRGGQLDVLLIKQHSGRDPIRLNVKSMGRGQFACGHYDLEVEKSHAERIVWGDRRNRAKFSEWVREDALNRGRSRSRSRSRRRHRSRSRRRHRSRSNSRRHRDRSGDRNRDERNASPPHGFSGHLPHSGVAGGSWSGPSFPGPPPGLPPALPPPGHWHGVTSVQGGGCWSPWGSPVPPSYGWLGVPPGPPSPIAAGAEAGEGNDLYADLQGSEPGHSQPAAQTQSVWSVVSTPGAWAPPAPNHPAQLEPPLDDVPRVARSRESDLQAERSVQNVPNLMGEAASAVAMEDDRGEVALPEPHRLSASQRSMAPEAVIILNPDGLDESQASQKPDGPGLEDIVEPSAPNILQDSQHCSPAAPAEPAQSALALRTAASDVEVVLSVGAGLGAQSEASRAADPRDPRRRRQIPSSQPAPEPAEVAQPVTSLPAESTPRVDSRQDCEGGQEAMLLAYDALLLGGSEV